MNCKLDNPVWHALNEIHSEHCLSFEKLKCYDPEYCPFGGFVGTKNIADQIDQYAALTGNFFIVGDKPETSSALLLNKELVCLQMIIDRRIEIGNKENIVLLEHTHADELFRLVNLVQPGYFKTKTRLLGDYFGIFKNGRLVAVTGERMKMNELTEVSAVVTHPDHIGKGYAKQLIAHTVNKIIDEGKLPFLHVSETNIHAIDLYQRLGFNTRRKISFWNFCNKRRE